MREPEPNEPIAGRYRLEGLLARGGMGEVFAAFDERAGTRVAIKRQLTATGTQASTALYFMREFHALSSLRHPRIIEVYDYGVDRGVPFYTMELLDGQDLLELSPVPFREACRYLRDVASSLALLHARRLLHRDLSPRNVRRTSDGRCKLLDFGAMVPFGVPPNITGTPPFIAPEVLQGGPLDQRSDLYSLGALAYFVLTGRNARAVRDIAALSRAWAQPIVRPKRLVQDVPTALDDLIIELLSVNGMQRPGSAAEVIERLSAVAELESQDDTEIARSFFEGFQLLDRNTQRARLGKRVTQTLTGHGAAVVVCGESGTGRSRMLAEAAVIGQTNGLTVFRAVARPRGTTAGLAAELVQGLFQAAPVEAQHASAGRPLVTSIKAQSFAADSGDAQALLLRELSEFVQEVARARPLLVTVDDLERADELGSALVAALAHQSSACPLTVVASYDTRYAAPVLAQVPSLAETITLGPLDRRNTILLVLSLFGDVPNLERTGDWLYRVAAGNPKLTLQLAEHLLAQGVVRYVDGSWVLPSDVERALPPSAAEILLLRFSVLSAEARGLAELLCVSRAGASVERILELARQPPEAVFGALEELVRSEVLESAGNDYAFARDALRESLLGTLDPERRRQLHAVWADRLLSENPTAEERFEAGWHLVHTNAELRGADILAEIAPSWVERRINMTLAVPALERTLEIYRRHDRPLAKVLYLRSLLVMSSYLFNHRLADKHAQVTLDALYPLTGLPLFERWSHRVGSSLALVSSFVWTFLRWTLQSPATRGPHIFDALKHYARACMGLVGLRTLAIDVDGVEAALDRMRLFASYPVASMRLLHAFAKAILLINQGRRADSAALVQGLRAQLDSSTNRSPHMNEAERQDLLVGVLMLEGLNECYRQGSTALGLAHRLEQFGTPVALAGSLRISMTYHILRGDTEETKRFRRLLDLSAIQNGTVWQIDWLAAPIEGLAASIWYDLVGMHRALDELERMTREVPSFAKMRDTLRVSYHYRRGDYAAAVRLGEAYIEAHAPFTLLGWTYVYSQTALSQLELGNAQRALEICEMASAVIGDRDRRYAIDFSVIDAAYATTLAVIGERERGENMFRALVEQLRAADDHTRAVIIHEYRVNMARLLGDRPGIAAALKDMQEAALASGNPSAIMLADLAAGRRAHTRSSPLPSPIIEPPDQLDLTQTKDETQSSGSRGEPLLESRAQKALQMLEHLADGGEGYVFLFRHGELELVASLDDRPAPVALVGLLATMPANDQLSVHRVTMPNNETEAYSVVRISDPDGECIGLAALRGGHIESEAISASLLSEVFRALTDADRSLPTTRARRH